MEEDEIISHILLDFNGKLQPEVFNNKIFIKIINLDKKNPLVQINDLTFKGTFKPCMGTSLFFDEVEDPKTSNDISIKPSPIHLNHIVSQDRILSLKQVKLKKKIEDINEDQAIKLNLKWNYKTLLEKFENGTLDFSLIDARNNFTEDKTINSHVLEITQPESSGEQDSNLDHPNEECLSNVSSNLILNNKYQKLKKLARRPVKRFILPELVTKCEQKYKESYELHNIKCQIQQPANAFFENPLPINEDTLYNAVDIERCILYGIILPSENNPRILTNREKNALLTLDNFDNLSLPARYYVLQLQLQNLEEYAKNAPKEKLNKCDKFGRTPLETLKVYKELVSCLKMLVE
ncbi:unnamed protein product [Brassicogethes aeneus]|uniref:Transcription factor TFIIIC triple barrel domain-containing protein n=1 Tax=Brassicogethes aeneus TaxID=1431903 RepID=A0A9P0FE29_BRAAE|nr:unnamed protein product [Brassicogethes aeneus]